MFVSRPDDDSDSSGDEEYYEQDFWNDKDDDMKDEGAYSFLAARMFMSM